MRTVFAAMSLLMITSLPPRASATEDGIVEAPRQIEARLNARVGLVVHDTGTGRIWRYRADERFPLVSTFKVLACAALLARTDVKGKHR